MLKLRLDGRIPSKKNSRITTRSGRSFPSKSYSAWHKDASAQLSSQDIGPVQGPVYVRYRFTFDGRRQDISNKIESVNDLLVDNGIIPDDNYLEGIAGFTAIARKGKELGVDIIINEI